MICFKCGEQNPYGTKVCIRCNARIINVPPVDEGGKIDIKEIGGAGDPFGIKSKKFDFQFPYMAGNFLHLRKVIEGILAGTMTQDKLYEVLEILKKDSSNYLYRALPGIEKKIQSPLAEPYRDILSKAANLVKNGHEQFLEAIEEIEKIFQDGQNYHLEKGLSICYKGSNLVSLGCVLAEKFRKKESLEHVEREIEEYLKKENIILEY